MPWEEPAKESPRRPWKRGSFKLNILEPPKKLDVPTEPCLQPSEALERRTQDRSDAHEIYDAHMVISVPKSAAISSSPLAQAYEPRGPLGEGTAQDFAGSAAHQAAWELELLERREASSLRRARGKASYALLNHI